MPRRGEPSRRQDGGRNAGRARHRHRVARCRCAVGGEHGDEHPSDAPAAAAAGDRRARARASVRVGSRLTGGRVSTSGASNSSRTPFSPTTAAGAGPTASSWRRGATPPHRCPRTCPSSGRPSTASTRHPPGPVARARRAVLPPSALPAARVHELQARHGHDQVRRAAPGPRPAHLDWCPPSSAMPTSAAADPGAMRSCSCVGRFLNRSRSSGDRQVDPRRAGDADRRIARVGVRLRPREARCQTAQRHGRGEQRPVDTPDTCGSA